MTLKIDRIEIGHVIVRHFEQDGAGVNAVLQATLQRLEGKVNQIMATQAEFQAKIDNINANTTASAAAAQVMASNFSALRVQLDDVLTKAGVPADVEAQILGQLDTAVDATTALKTFLEATAAGPVTAPEPPPVEVPPVA